MGWKRKRVNYHRRTNIEWDTDGEIALELPTEVSLDKWTDDEEEILNCITDMLYDMYKFCVINFDIHYRKDENK